MRTVVLVFCVLAMCSCHSKKSKTTLRFETSSLLREAGDCKGKNRACALVDFNFPLAKSGNPLVTDVINRQIFLDLTQELGTEITAPDFEFVKKSVEGFLNEWKTEDAANRSNGGEGEQGWEISVSGELRLQTEKMAAVSLGHYSYTGGAHPNSYVSVYNFNLKTGKTFTWQEVVTDPEAVKKIAERKFREVRQLPPDADLADEGFFMNEPFYLGNFELQSDGIYVFYNPYDAASYAAGPTDFLLSYEELGKLFKREVVF